jgi:hypothetical protein
MGVIISLFVILLLLNAILVIVSLVDDGQSPGTAAAPAAATHQHQK